jgi:hypothetical protein
MSKRRRLALRAAGIGTATLVLGATIAAAATYLHAGPQGDGTAITPVGYRVTPAGSQTNLGDLPLALRLSPDSKMLLVSNDGQGTQGLQVVNPATSKVVQTIPYASPHSLFVGLAFSPDGSTAYASGGGLTQLVAHRVRRQAGCAFRGVRENSMEHLVFSNVGLLAGVEFLGPSNSMLKEAALLRS